VAPLETPLLQTESLCKQFTRGDEVINALNSVNLSVKTGEFVSITGPSGSGKSTLMYILGLLDKPTSGSYLLDGKRVDNLTDKERSHIRNKRIGFVFQGFHLLPREDSLRNVMLPLVYSSGISTKMAMEAAEISLKRVGLQDRIRHRPNELSGGQRQRVAIARALVNNPAIVFADEPTGNLDSKTGAGILTLFQELRASGVTIVLVTHDPSIAARAERRIRVQDGVATEER
jgi:putative ABC transport system ATP-binding protein